MALRQLLLLGVAIICLLFAGFRFFGHPRRNAPVAGRPVYVQTWRCRADGFVTNLTLAEIDRIYAEGKTRSDPNNLAIKLYACPKCGKLELEQTAVPVQTENRP